MPIDPMPRYGLYLALSLAALTVYRFWALAAADLSLYFDEAYYWTWSTEPAFGYYSKPPLIAWTLGVASAVCGEGELCLRTPALLLFPAAAWLIYATTRRVFDARAGFFAGLAYASLPVVAFYSWWMTTDALLAFCWALAWYGLVRALEQDLWWDWLLVGLALGLGLLSKYTMSVFLLSVVCYAWLVPERRARLLGRKAWAGLAVAGLLFLPNVLWNLSHGFASFRHTAAIAQWDREWFHPDRLLVFVGGQILLFGPPLAVAVALCRWQTRRAVWQDGRYRLLLCFAVPMLALYSLQALLARANLNWGMAAFVAAAPLAAVYLLDQGRMRALVWAIAMNFALDSLVYHYGVLARGLGFELSPNTDVYAQMRGWSELGEELGKVLARYPEAGVACDNRRVLAELMYYVRPHPFGVIWNPTGEVKDHFRLKADIADSPRHRFVFVAESNTLDSLRPHFREIIDLGALTLPLYPGHALHYRLFLVQEFRGYRS